MSGRGRALLKKAAEWAKVHWKMLLGAIAAFGLLLAFRPRRVPTREEIREDLARKTELELVKTELRVQAVEEQYEEAVTAVQGQHREEYEAVRAQGPRKVARWLNDFDRRTFK